MNCLRTLFLMLVIASPGENAARGAQQAEPVLQNLPAGVIVKSSTQFPADQLKPLEAKFGGKIQRLTNSVIQVHGSPIQVNVIAAADEASADAIQAAMGKIKAPPFCIRRGQLIIEYVGKSIDAALARKTSYELGLLDKPDTVQYRVSAELATIDKADYMSCNRLFNHFLTLETGENQEAASEITELSKKFAFGHTLTLRNPKIDGASCRHTFEPTAVEAQAGPATIAYRFDKPLKRYNVPFVAAVMEVAVNHTGLREATAGSPSNCTAPTPFWPADDASIMELARGITAGQTTNGAKAMAILKWLSPGHNLKYSGQTGSRWGTLKVLKQKFGHCWDFSDCFITLARASGVPSRQVGGWLYGSSGHIWAEFFIEGKGWQQVDPTGGGKLRCGIYHIPYFTSEDGEMPILYLSMPKIEMLDVD